MSFGSKVYGMRTVAQKLVDESAGMVALIAYNQAGELKEFGLPSVHQVLTAAGYVQLPADAMVCLDAVFHHPNLENLTEADLNRLENLAQAIAAFATGELEARFGGA